MNHPHLDALVIGAGFGGIYQLYSLLKLGFNVKLIEKAPGVGGVWFSNNYPGATTDTASYLYRYTWDKDDLQSYLWANNYLSRDEVVAYLDHVVDKHNLRQHIRFSTEMVAADWSEAAGKWHVKTDQSEVIATTYLVMATGVFTRPNVPKIPGMGTFRGPVMHTASWDNNVDIVGKRVGVIGCGSSGIQVSDAIAPIIAELHCFIRHPPYSIPLRFRPVPSSERSDINSRYNEIHAAQLLSKLALDIGEPDTKTLSVTEEERQQTFESLWRDGNSFRFKYGGFGDLASNAEANEEACKFLRAKIRSIVKDPAKADTLTPNDLFTRRPPCDQGWYEMFNQDNVFAVDIQETPITAIEENGIRTSDGKIHELDIIVLATGFQSVRDNGINGRGGVSIGDYWAEEIKTFLGIFIHSFPNLFMVNGPQGPFSIAPVTIETEVDFISEMLSYLRNTDRVDAVVECTLDKETEWVTLCGRSADTETLENTVSSELTSTNIAGAKRSVIFFYNGLKQYRNHLQEVKDMEYRFLLS
ncbi:cyclohexanone monooxygenase [Hypoxylon rubiginosum]|uniref:Cyclohexanone monooxygenase n=1 Tax=Hypoxylon rubiginosum TaxID=110542 RepID=A0ACC0CR94_9PEZI|nr:cyclohexanone monooxygenase [Hypoxylon rubiginosum]